MIFSVVYDVVEKTSTRRRSRIQLSRCRKKLRRVDVKAAASSSKQKGQHPLTGQRAPPIWGYWPTSEPNAGGKRKKGKRKKGNLSLLTCSHTDQCLEPDMNNNARSLHHNSYGKSKNVIQRADKRIVGSTRIKYCNGQPMNRIVSPTARKKLSIDLCPAT